MRKPAAVLLVVVIVGAACSGRSERSTDLFEVPVQVPPTEPGSGDSPIMSACAFAVSGQGAEVQGVLEGSAAEGALFLGDVIVDLAGQPILSSPDLVRVVGAHDVGAVVSVAFFRDGAANSVDIVLGAHPTAAGRPLLGVEVITPVSRYTASDLPVPEPPLEGRLVRAVLADGQILLLDPVNGTWELTASSAPDTSWVVVGSDIYSFQLEQDGEAASITRIDTDESLPLATADWQVAALVTSTGSLALGVANRSVARAGGSSAETAVLAIDPLTGTLVWEWLPEEGTGEFPETAAIFGFANPGRDRVAVVMALEGQANRFRYAVLDSQGRELTGWPEQGEFLPVDALVMGWFDDRSLLYATGSELIDLFAFDLDTRASRPVELPEAGSFPRLWAAGDGRHLIADDSARLLMIDTEDGEARPLAEGCEVLRVADPGWGILG